MSELCQPLACWDPECLSTHTVEWDLGRGLLEFAQQTQIKHPVGCLVPVRWPANVVPSLCAE
jgi:hypothetical protein